MKSIFSIVLLLSCLALSGQENKEISIKTNVSEATVFIHGAQVIRRKSVEVLPGKSFLKFVELSPYMDAKSIQVRVNGDVTVLSVNHQFNYLDSASRSKELQEIEAKIKALNEKLQIENANLSINNEESSFLRDNRIIGGKNQEVSLTNLKETANFYRDKISALKMAEIGTIKNIEKLNLEISSLEQQRNQLVSSKQSPVSEVLVKIDSKRATNCDLELTYLVKNAGWFPSYDIRANSIDQPIQLTYKANIRQSTKEDWKNITLKLSSSDPSSGGVAPVLETYYLGYNSRPPKYTNISNQVTGRIFDASDNSPLPGAVITVSGTTIGTVSDIEGNYTLSLPSSNSTLEVNYIGYTTERQSVNGSSLNFYLQANQSALEEVVVVGYGTKRKSAMALQGKVSGVAISKVAKISNSLSSSNALSVEQNETTTAFEFEIKTPYTINSDNKMLTVDIDNYELDATFEYYAVPKVDKDAFLIANIVHWEKLNLLAGEANLFFENTFVGKSILDTRYISDTLNLSLGRDKSVLIKRNKLKEFTTKQFFGNKKEEMRAWQITVKNNKKSPIEMSLFDQIPVSTLEEIEVTVENLSQGELNKETGQVKWKFTLDPSAKKDFELKYKVKYPKDRSLIIE